MADLVECPFNSSHLIRKTRLPYHIIKCRKIYQKNGTKEVPLKPCPFNAKHIILETHLEDHLATCVDRMQWQKEFSIEKNSSQLKERRSRPSSSLSSFSHSSSTSHKPPPPPPLKLPTSIPLSIPKLAYRNKGTFEWDDDDDE